MVYLIYRISGYLQFQNHPKLVVDRISSTHPPHRRCAMLRSSGDSGRPKAQGPEFSGRHPAGLLRPGAGTYGPLKGPREGQGKPGKTWENLGKPVKIEKKAGETCWNFMDFCQKPSKDW